MTSDDFERRVLGFAKALADVGTEVEVIKRTDHGECPCGCASWRSTPRGWSCIECGRLVSSIPVPPSTT